MYELFQKMGIKIDFPNGIKDEAEKIDFFNDFLVFVHGEVHHVSEINYDWKRKQIESLNDDATINKMLNSFKRVDSGSYPDGSQYYGGTGWVVIKHFPTGKYIRYTYDIDSWLDDNCLSGLEFEEVFPKSVMAVKYFTADELDEQTLQDSWEWE